MNFCDSICAHLAKYKVDALGISEDGIFTYRKRNVPKAHIFPTRDRDLNILPEYRELFFASPYSKIKLHKFFHHLNSSQAMCINLFYPLIAESALGLVTRFLGIEPANNLQPCFEKKSEIEQAIRRTSFDFHLRYEGSNDIYFEVKYSEDGFATAKADDEHRDKFLKTYLPLVERSTFLSEKCRDESFFLGHYQILRNFIHVASTSYVILLFPSANSSVTLEAFEAYEKLLTDAGRARVMIVFLEEMVSFLEANCPVESLLNHYTMFRTKYLPSWSLKPNNRF